MNTLRTKENPLINLHEQNDGSVAVMGRELHEFLEIGTEYKKWFSRMAEYGFEENIDYQRVTQNCPTLGGVQSVTNHILTLDMSKEISMIQRNEKRQTSTSILHSN